ncbi:class II glutamine amidotransferase [Lacisediminihabitans profunda]|uniref:Glutamine amidotransferase type-2 domain-containing protein n=1 Tax=Lacisediminihabitans profunda TaxID=2594790 RepID=A0A5C8UPR0_9MICO|nr:class II glutamine amidotransferase [Lacisediminihabitans profunda]TXN30412.1 hypothetical protein FVP33_10485 [Lacisediminihabitans profunda]
MLGYVAPRAHRTSEAIGTDTLAQFTALAHLHADGWGVATLDASGDVGVTGGRSQASPAELAPHVDPPARARTIYLRFASRGSPPTPENTQPFLRDRLAFQHNGLMAPRDRALEMLSVEDRLHLRGTTDSEVYFAVLRSELQGQPTGDPGLSDVARAVTRLRAQYPASCLNALLLTKHGLIVVHSAGTASAPLAAFAAREADPTRLPPGHGSDYNILRYTSTESGAHVVSTTGVEQDGWTDLPADSISLITAAAVIHLAL